MVIERSRVAEAVIVESRFLLRCGHRGKPESIRTQEQLDGLFLGLRKTTRNLQRPEEGMDKAVWDRMKLEEKSRKKTITVFCCGKCKSRRGTSVKGKWVCFEKGCGVPDPKSQEAEMKKPSSADSPPAPNKGRLRRAWDRILGKKGQTDIAALICFAAMGLITFLTCLLVYKVRADGRTADGAQRAAAVLEQIVRDGVKVR